MFFWEGASVVVVVVVGHMLAVLCAMPGVKQQCEFCSEGEMPDAGERNAGEK